MTFSHTTSVATKHMKSILDSKSKDETFRKNNSLVMTPKLVAWYSFNLRLHTGREELSLKTKITKLKVLFSFR